jgi:sigma-B regulation protein RsbU (phosphoserine phosphatase)
MPSIRRFRPLLALCLLFASLLPLRAQSFDLANSPQSLITLDGLWRFHPGDDPSWANPAFDDSAWPLLRGDRSWSVQGYAGLGGYAWYRFTLRIPAGSQPTSISLPGIFTRYTLYIDGVEAGHSTATGSDIIILPPLAQSFPLTTAPSSVPRTVHVAIRVWHSPVWKTYVGGGPHGAALAGGPDLIATRLQVTRQSNLLAHVDLFVDSVLRAIIGLLVLGLFALRPREREYLWFAAVQLFGGADDVLNFAREAYGKIPFQLFDLYDATLAAGFWVAGLFFFATLLRQQRGPWFRVALVLAILSPLAVPSYWFGWLSVPLSDAFTVLCVLPSLIWVLSLLIARSIQGDADARILLLPALLVYGVYIVANVVIDLNQIGWIYYDGNPFNAGVDLAPFHFSFYTLANILFLMAMLAFLLRRFSLARREEERLHGEFEAARQVQQILVPETDIAIPGFTIESIYLPAESVGGDFFQQIPDNFGGVLLVVGDVAGKGLPAAMLVSMLVGAIRSEAAHTQQPVELLTTLNDRMLGRARDGFATCLIAHLSASGQLVIANAGHIPPWLNGRALDLPGALPLGVDSNPGYSEFAFALAPGDRLTFVSDGVIEARNQVGELFGFDRTAAISREPAISIAHSAQHFGQDDDITVLTLAFAPAAR